MAVTHADLEPGPRSSDLGSKTGLFLMVLSIFSGLLCFILCLFAEANRSEVSWLSSNEKGNGEKYECVYSGSGKIPLLCGAGAFFSLAIAMVVEHTFLLIAVTNSTSSSSPLLNWDLDSEFDKSIACHAAFFFIATWISFAVGEILLLITLSVESGHLNNWKTPRDSCLVIGQGLFTAAGVFGLATVFLASGLYITALRSQKLIVEQENVRREVLAASVLYASPPRSPTVAGRPIIRDVANENPVERHIQSEHSLAHYLREFEKYVM